MKRIYTILMIPAIAFSYMSCSKLQEGVLYTSNADDDREIHFIQSSIVKEFAQDLTEGVVELTVARPGNKGEYSVGLLNRGDDADFFAVPENVVIPDGQYSVTVPVSVNLENLLMGSDYKTTLYVGDREAETGNNSVLVSQYTDKVDISVSFELVWEECYRVNEAGEQVRQLATYNYNGFYKGSDSGLEVDKAVGTNIYRVNDWASGVSFRFILNEDNTCVVPAQSIGYFNNNYNEYVFVSDMAVYTKNDAAYNSYPCTFDGKSTFDFYLIYYVSEGYFAQGEESLVFETEVDTTPEMAIEFDGIETTATGFKAPKLSFYKNEHTKYYKATVVQGDITGNKQMQNQIRQQLIDDTYSGTVPVVTLYDDDTSIWNVPSGNCTAVAVAYDNDDTACELFMERFTCDPDGLYAVKVNEFEWFNDPENISYSPYKTIFWSMKTENVATLKYVCMKTDILEYLVEASGMSYEEIVAGNGNEVDEEFVAEANSEDGFQTLFQTLDKGVSYTLMVLMTNAFGDTEFVMKKASTKGHSAEDFDRTKEIDDFIGSFKVTATIDAGSSSSVENFRMDILRMNDTDVIIRGMSNMRDYSPEIIGYYDKDLHMIIIEPQAAGMYKSNYARLGFSDGLSIYWGNTSMAIGYIGDTLYWASSPGSSADVSMYQFLLFSEENATSGTYLKESVGSRVYSELSMQPIGQSTGTAYVASNVKMLALGGKNVKSYLAE